MKISLNYTALLFLALIWVGLVESKFKIRISKYQIENLRKIANNLSLDPNLFSKNKEISSVVVDRIVDINERYRALLDFILSFENWIKRFSSEYHGNSHKNRDVLASIISINAEFEVLKLKFNELSDGIDAFIDKALLKESSKCIHNERRPKLRYKKEIEGFYKQLITLNLDVKRLVSCQHKLITSSSLYIIRLGNVPSQVNSVKEHEIVDMSNENSLYDLWIYYEHHRLPNLKEKIDFLSRSISLLIRQNRIILEFLLNRYKVLTKQYSEILDGSKDDYNLLDNSELIRLDNLRAGSTKLQECKNSELKARHGSSIKQQQQFFRKCLDADELGLIIPLDSVWKVDGWRLNIELENVINMVKFLIEEFESKCLEFQRNYDILLDFKIFISGSLEVNTTNINDFFFSGRADDKKSVLCQLTYQVSQLNTISEFAHTLEEKLKSYHCFNIPCYYGIINYYLKQSFNTFFDIFSLKENHFKESENFTDIYDSQLTTETIQNFSFPIETGLSNITITDEMTAFMFNASEIANSAGNLEEFKKFPNFETKYDFAIFTNTTCFAPDVNIGGLSEHLEILMDRFLKNIIVHEKKVNENE